MVKVKADYFSIDQICESGQCFRLNKLDHERYMVIAYDNYLEIKQTDNEITFYCSREEYHNVWENYFDIKNQYGKYIGAVDKEDQYLYNAVQFGKGIRILNQELWEIIVSFIISQRNNIKRIKKCISLLCETYGEKKVNEKGDLFYTFPKPQALANATMEGLLSCNLGYRSRYVLKAAESVINGELDLMMLQELSYSDAKKALLGVCGVGNKVADCICLFALHHLEAFPVDTHIKQVLDEYYRDGFPFDLYLLFAGVIQQYIFYYNLKNGGAHQEIASQAG